MGEEVIKIEDILIVFQKRWRLIVSITTAATLISLIVSFFVIAPKYEVSTKLFIGKESNAGSQNKDESYNNNDVQMYQKLLKTYSEIIATNDLVDQAIANRGLDLKSSDILKNLTVNPRVDTQILEISYIDKNKEEAAEIVNLLTNQFISYSKELIPNGNVRVIESVRIPENPVSPNKKLNIAIALFLGFMVSVGLSFLLEFIDNSFRTKEEVERTLSIPVIGMIPDEYEFE